MEEHCWNVALRQLTRDTLEDKFIFLMGILSTLGKFQAMNTQEIYDYVSEKEAEDRESE